MGIWNIILDLVLDIDLSASMAKTENTALFFF